MKYRKQITILIIIISIAASIATLFGIFSDSGKGSYNYTTIRGETIEIYGKGVYRHMSSEVAIQGIAQDYVTLFVGIPLLILGLLLYRKEKRYGQFLLAGVIFYFFLTYLFYLAMAMYNELFLVYVILMSCSLFGVILNLISFDYELPPAKSGKDVRMAGWFLLINTILIAFLWLSSILPPLFNGALYPVGLHHYTTLIVQGFDLGIFLPLGFVSAILALKNNNYGKVFTTIYLVFLALLMTALTSKVIFMANEGVNVIPVIFIMPTIGFFSIIISFRLLRQINSAG